ncbi:MAG: ROK family protein [Chloroflexi bacterium]|nr:ROK family protein [Chloroflexota bacterium]
MNDRQAIGIDIGGSAIRAACVDLDQGAMAGPRRSVDTPRPAVPDAIAGAIAALLRDELSEPGPVGAGFPAVIKGGIAMTAANVARDWIGTNVEALFAAATGRPVAVLNDADAAGLAEMRFGAGKGRSGVVIMVTLGTGIGTGLFVDGKLVPNTELGHIEVRGKEAELRASAAVKTKKKLSWKAWSARVEEYLQAMDDLFWPDLFIIGGGVSATPEKFLPRMKVRAPMVPAALANDAGIIGAALFGAERPRADV